MSLDGLKGLLADIASLPPTAAAAVAGNPDDDFQQPPTQAPEQQQLGGGGGAAAPSASGAAGAAAGKEGKPAVAYTHVPSAKRKEVYRHMHARMGGKAINAPESQVVIQAVFNAFPPGAITKEGVKKVRRGFLASDAQSSTQRWDPETLTAQEGNQR